MAESVNQRPLRYRARQLLLRAVLTMALLVTAAVHADERRSIAMHEPLAIPPALASGHARTLAFEAFGRPFRLALSPNPRLASIAHDPTVTALQGRLAGKPRSWARLTSDGNFIAGFIRDGRETFIIEPRYRAQASLMLTDDSGSAHVIYRLSDTTITSAPPVCGVRAGARVPTTNAQAAMDELTTELSDLVTLQAQGARLRLTAAVIADYEFFLAEGSVSQTENAVVERLNIVDGIYTEQLGIEIELADITVLSSPNSAQPPFTSTDNPEALLDQLSRYRLANQTQYGISHLISGRDFPGTTAGIAYQGQAIGSSLVFGVCDNQTAASLSSSRFSMMTSALIIAHEIGHNFGSPHDGEVTQPANPCESSPETFLMAPDINNSREFSPCSLDQIQPVLDAARSVCLTEIPNAGVAVSSVAAITQAPGTAFEIAFDVQNTGELDAPNVIVNLTVEPAELTVTALSSSSGACDLATLTCDLGTLAGADIQTVAAGFETASEGAFLVTARATTNFDENLSDNAATAQVTVAEIPAGGGSSGGGGALGFPALTLLLLKRARRRVR